jgi:hypothetical protein
MAVGRYTKHYEIIPTSEKQRDRLRSDLHYITMIEFGILTDSKVPNLTMLGKEGYLPKPAARGKYDLRECILGFVQYAINQLKDGTVANGDSGDRLREAKIRKEEAQAAKVELFVQQRSGELVDVKEVTEKITEAVLTTKKKLEVLPSRCANLCEGKSAEEITEILKREIKSALLDLSRIDLNH